MSVSISNLYLFHLYIHVHKSIHPFIVGSIDLHASVYLSIYTRLHTSTCITPRHARSTHHDRARRRRRLPRSQHDRLSSHSTLNHSSPGRAQSRHPSTRRGSNMRGITWQAQGPPKYTVPEDGRSCSRSMLSSSSSSSSRYRVLYIFCDLTCNSQKPALALLRN